MSEVWKPVVGWQYYEVSSEGRVRSVDRQVPAKGGSIANRKGKVLSPQLHRGYWAVRLRDLDKDKTFKVHTLVLRAFDRDKNPNEEARHKNGNANDNRPSNLEWGTKSENNLDRVRHGTHTQASKTECPAGHPYDSINTYIDPQGRRHCRICKREAYLRHMDKKGSK